MDIRNFTIAAFAVAGLIATPSLGMAQGDIGSPDEKQNRYDDDYRGQPAEGQQQKSRRAINVERAGDDPIPQPPRPARGDSKVYRQAGVGSAVAFTEQGVLEFGGSIGLAGSDDFFTATLSPSLGWFVADNLQLTGLVQGTYLTRDGADAGIATALIEPSYHVPFTDQIFGFAGVGGGVAYYDEEGLGLAVQPRLGANFLVGRSGMIKPSVFYNYSTVDAIETADGTVLATDSAYGFNLGYTIMW